MAFYFIFWDGVGYGKKNPTINPFFSAKLPTMQKLFEGNLPSLSSKKYSSEFVSLSPVTTTLRMPGLPQSGTGQTAIMTGMNAPKYVGKHFGPHPYSTLVPIIKEKNLFSQLQQRGKKFFFANGYPQRYFDYIFGPKGKVPTIALSYLSTGNELNTHESVNAKTAVSADISGTRWKELGHSEIEPTTPSEAGILFSQLAKRYDLIFFEYFISDHAGHSQDMTMAIEVLERMDGFISGILENFDWTNDILLMISDHGNIEDLSIKTHTKNPVPLIVLGKNHMYFASRVKNLTHITPTILSYFDSMNEK
jgi:2,3-bisphosphoglycerate-independent phosphoglycerate mutase